jgi:ABC-type polysaccharide/polyol phosphate export permease
MIYLTMIVAIFSACLTYFLSLHLKKGPTLASAIVTLSSGLLLPYFFTEGATLALVATTASYAAMVSEAKFPKLIEMVGVGAICGLVFSLTHDVFVGVGGRLGSIAAISGLSWLGLKQIIDKFKKQNQVTIDALQK